MLHLLTSQAVTWVLATALAVIQPRFLGPSAVGQLRLAVALWTIGSVLIELGTSLYLKSQVARCGRPAFALIGPVLAARYFAFGVVSLAFAVIGAIARSPADFVTIMVIMGVGTILSASADTYLAVFLGLERMSVPALVGVVGKFFTTIVTIAVLLAGGGVLSVVAVGATSYLLTLGLLLRSYRRIGGIRPRVRWTGSRRIVRDSLGFMAAGLSLTVYLHIDAVVIAGLVDNEALGWYSSADVLYGSLLFFVTIVCSSVFPTFARLHATDQDGLRNLVRKVIFVLTLVSMPMGLGTAAVGTAVAPLLYGEQFSEAGPVLSVFGLVLLLTTYTILFGTVAMATGRVALWNTLLVVGILMTIVLDMILVPWADDRYGNGAIGGAVAYLVTDSIMVVVGVWKVAPYVLDRSTVWRVSRIAAAGATMLGAVLWLHDQPLAWRIGAGVVVYPVALLALGVITGDERQMLRQIALNVRGGGS